MANPERWRRFEDLPHDLRGRLERLPAFLEERDVLLAYVFGSLASTAERPDRDDVPSDSERRRPEGGTAGGCEPGDIDLAILTGEAPAEALRSDLREALGSARFDLVDLRRASPLLRFHVVRDGSLLYSRDDETLNRFELRTLQLYRDTAPRRRLQREILRRRMDAWS